MITSKKAYIPENHLLPLGVSVVLTLALFYIDEGYYDFRWMLTLSNWFAFLLYVGGLYVVQLFLQVIVFRWAPEKWRVWLATLLGVPLALYLLMGVLLG